MLFEVERPVLQLAAYDWSAPRVHPRLRGDEIHVWRAALDIAPARVESLCRILSSDERRRAARFHFERDRDRFVVARASLRILLGRYLGQDPAQLNFTYNARGKPTLAQNSSLTFNLSHSDRLALYAVARDRELGIDVERVRADLPWAELAERYFSPGEMARVRALPESQRETAFFNCWTRKEAYIKARGEGFAVPLDQFEVSLAPGEPARLLQTQSDALEASRWSLHDLNPDEGYVGALAVQAPAPRLCFWELLNL